MSEETLRKESQWALRSAKAHFKRNTMRWESNRNLMFGKMTADERGPAKNSIAEAYGTWRTLVSNILAQAPEVLIQSKKPDLEQFVVGLSDVVNYDFKVGCLRRCIERALWQNFPYGMGVIAEDFKTKKLYKEDTNEVVGVDSLIFDFRNIAIRDVMFDPDGFDIDLRDHRFIFLAHYKTVYDLQHEQDDDGERVYTNTEDIEAFPRANQMSKTERDKYFMMGSSGSGIDYGMQLDRGDKPPEEFYQIKVWRMYDRENEQVTDWLDHDHRLVRRDKWPMAVSVQDKLQFPIKILALNVDPDRFYPTPEVDLIRSQIANEIKLNETLMTDLTTKIRRYIGLSPYVNDKTMGKLLDPKMPNSYIVTSNLDMASAQADVPKVDSARDIIHKVEDITPDPNLAAGIQEIRNQLTNIMGFSQPGRAGGPQVRSAKEAARIADQMQRSLISRQTTVEEFVRDMAIYHVMLLKATAGDSPLAQKRYFPVVSDMGQLQVWGEFDPTGIPDEKYLSWDVFVGSSTPMTLDSKRAQTMQMLQVMGPILQSEGYSLIPLINEFCKVWSIRNPDQFIRNQKGAARVLLGAMVEAGKKGAAAPPDLLLKAGMEVIQAVLSPAEIQMVIKAMQGEAGGGGGGGNGAKPGANPPQSMDPMKDAGNTVGGVTPS